MHQEQSPTSLHLFRFAEPMLRRARNTYSQAKGFRREFETAKAAFETFDNQVFEKADEFKRRKGELEGERDRLYELTTVPAAYGMIVQDFQERGYTEEEAFRHFLKCFRINSILSSGRVSPNFLQFLRTAPYQSLPQIITSPLARKAGVGGMLEELVKNPPKGIASSKPNQLEWRSLAVKHAYFPRLIKTSTNPKENQYRTSQDNKPGWLKKAEEEGMPPDHDVVKKEWDEHDEQLKATKDSLAQIIKEFLELSDHHQTVSSQTFAAVERARRVTFPDAPKNFLELIAFLGATKDVFVYAEDIDQIAQTPVANLSEQPPEQIRKKTIQEFVDGFEKNPSMEILALYFEEKLKEGKVIDSAQDILTPNQLGMFTNLLDYLRTNDPESAEIFYLLQALPDTYQVLNTNIRPLLSTLPAHKLQDITHILHSRSKEPAQEVIWTLAGSVTDYLDSTKVANNPQLPKCVRGVKDFATVWLSNHFLWAYQELARLCFIES